MVVSIKCPRCDALMAGCSPGQHTRACKKCGTPYIVTVGPAGVNIAARPGEQPETKTQEGRTAQRHSTIYEANNGED